jgi:tetratricopeptide (TPR) repeat protein
MDEEASRRWAEADAIFDRLLDLAPDERARALAGLDLDPDLRERVERLLAADAEAATRLDRPLLPALSLGAADLSGRVLGRWRLGPEIGRGGMAVVHAAEATDRPGLRAAVKLLTIGAVAADGLDRFRREQDILARLSHPHIAPLLDAGLTPDGTPWLAMALVEGLRIDDWCRQHHADVPARVRLMLEVCDAVAHAHQALVIHRDLKPGNVLVDPAGHVRLLDFGIARLADASDGERTATTHRALTPDYAAPEQFSGAPPSTAIDVWGLGALLYQLLTGSPPRAAAVLDGSLTRPSRAVADGHFGDPGTTQRARRAQQGDLDAIVLKALAPEPAQRYASVSLLAEDLKRWLAGQPVLAQPPTLRYRAGRFVRRHRGAVAAAAIAVLGVLGGLVVSLWQAQRAELAAAEARAQASRAEDQLRRAESLAEFLTRLFGASDPDRPAGERPTLENLLEAGAAQALDANDLDPAVQARMLTTIGRVHLLAGQPDRGLELIEAAVERARVAGDVARIELAGALHWRAFARSRGDSTKLDDADLAEAEALLRQHQPMAPLRIEIARRRAFQRIASLKPAEALALLEPILDGRWDGPAATDDDRIRLLDTVAMARQQVGDVAGSRRAFDESIALERAAGRATQRGFAITLANSAAAEIAGGNLDLAESRTREAIAIHDRIGANPSAWRANARLLLGQALTAAGRFDEAREAYEASNAEWARLQNLELEDYAFTHLARGRLAAAALDPAATERHFARFVELATDQQQDITGFRAEVDAERAITACAAGRIAEGESLKSQAEAALTKGSHDRDAARLAIAIAAARCALAAGEPERALARLDDPGLAEGLEALDPARRLRPALVRCEALRALDRGPECTILAGQAVASLDRDGLARHPYRGRFVALAERD